MHIAYTEWRHSCCHDTVYLRRAEYQSSLEPLDDDDPSELQELVELLEEPEELLELFPLRAVTNEEVEEELPASLSDPDPNELSVQMSPRIEPTFA